MSASDAEKWNAKWRSASEPGAPSAFFTQWLPVLLAELRRKPGARVLDAACGLGRHALPLARAGIAVDAADVSEVALEKLGCITRRELLPLKVLRADFSDPGISLAASRYDAVLDFFYLERPLFPVLARAARPGALLLFETRLAADVPGTSTNSKGFWLAPGELARLLHSHWRILKIEERVVGSDRLARAAARKR